MTATALAPDPGIAQPDGVRYAPSEDRLQRLLGLWWQDERPEWTDRGWWGTHVSDEVRRLLWLPPGPALVTALAELDGAQACPVDHTSERMLPEWPVPGRTAGWPCACQVIAAAAWDACASWLATRSAEALVTAAGAEPITFRTPHSGAHIREPAREELAHALRSSIPSMGNRISSARSLTRHPRLVVLVASGTISAWAGRLVTDHLTELDDTDADRVVTEVAHRVRERIATGRRPYDSAEVNRLARAARLRVCPEQAEQARVRAFAHRRVSVHPQGDGMATLVAQLADIDAFRIHRRLTAIAAGLASDSAADGSTDERTRDQLRADVLVDVLLDGASGGSSPAAGVHAGPWSATAVDDHGAGQWLGDATRQVQVQVVVTLPTLLGLVDEPAEVPGLGPIPAEVARTLAAEGRWRAWVTDAIGAVAATGSVGYSPGERLARHVRAREPRCRFPGCQQPSARCDLDHAVPWPRGRTTAENLGPLCRRHHNFKTHTPWDLDPAPPARVPTYADRDPCSWRWTSPAGLTIHEGPDPVLG